MTNCKYCGAELTENASFCIMCGNKIQVPSKPETKKTKYMSASGLVIERTETIDEDGNVTVSEEIPGFKENSEKQRIRNEAIEQLLAEQEAARKSVTSGDTAGLDRYKDKPLPFRSLKLPVSVVIQILGIVMVFISIRNGAISLLFTRGAYGLGNAGVLIGIFWIIASAMAVMASRSITLTTISGAIMLTAFGISYVAASSIPLGVICSVVSVIGAVIFLVSAGCGYAELNRDRM